MSVFTASVASFDFTQMCNARRLEWRRSYLIAKMSLGESADKLLLGL